MITLGILGGIGTQEILVLTIGVFFVIVCPIMWVKEYYKRKYWKEKAMDFEKRLLEKN